MTLSAQSQTSPCRLRLSAEVKEDWNSSVFGRIINKNGREGIKMDEEYEHTLAQDLRSGTIIYDPAGHKFFRRCLRGKLKGQYVDVTRSSYRADGPLLLRYASSKVGDICAQQNY